MSSSPNTNIGTTYQIANTKMVAPTEGPRALVAFLDFTGAKFSAVVDLTQQTQPPAQLSVIQGLFVDNHASTVDLLIQQQQTAQILIIKAGQQAYVPILAAATPVFNFIGANNASAGIVVPVYFYNVPIAPLVLGGTAIAGVNVSGGNLQVQDVSAENSLSILATNTGVFPPNTATGAANTTGSSATTIIAAAGAGIQLRITSIQFWNSSATGQTITLNDSASSEFYVPPTGGSNIVFNNPLSVAANTPLQFTPSPGGITVGANAQGYKA